MLNILIKLKHIFIILQRHHFFFLRVWEKKSERGEVVTRGLEEKKGTKFKYQVELSYSSLQQGSDLALMRTFKGVGTVW